MAQQAPVLVEFGDVCVPRLCGGSRRPEVAVGFPGTIVTERCDPHAGAENQSRVLWKSWCSSLPSRLYSNHFINFKI